MAEKLYPLAPPPGLFHNGTKLQASGRWYDGNGVRFHEGTIRPIGGWVQRTLTGDPITGKVNAAVSWESAILGRPAWLAIGTTTGLFAVSEDNQVFNITPAGTVGGTPYRWTLKVFGSYLYAAYALDDVDVNDTRNVFVWDGNTGGPAVYADNGTGTLPFYVYAVGVTPERFALALRGSDQPGVLRRAPDTGAVYDPAAGTVTLSEASGTPTPAGSPIFDPANGGVRF